jgi:hypothetical protein
LGYTIVWETSGVQFVFKNEFSSEDVLRSNEEFASAARSSIVKYALYNLIDVQEFTIKAEAIREVASIDAELYRANPDMKFAVVATQLVMAGLTRMYESYLGAALGGESWETQVFDSIADAREWIDSQPSVREYPM